MDTIVIKETDEMTLEVLTLALEMEGYRVFGIAGCREALLKLIRRCRPCLVLLDCGLHFYAGQDEVLQIKQSYPNLPVIALSCDNRIRDQYTRLAFDDYLCKPFDLGELYSLLDKHCQPQLNL